MFRRKNRNRRRSRRMSITIQQRLVVCWLVSQNLSLCSPEKVIFSQYDIHQVMTIAFWRYILGMILETILQIRQFISPVYYILIKSTASLHRLVNDASSQIWFCLPRKIVLKYWYYPIYPVVTWSNL